VNNIIERAGLAGELNAQSQISEGGKNLSGGQRQRIKFAHAIARNSSICLMDEVTSGLDSISKRKVIDELTKMSEDRLVIIVSHDDSILSAFRGNILTI